RKIAQSGRELAVRVVEIMRRQAQLFDVVGTLDASGGFADFLDGGQEQADEGGYDCDHHEQFDEGKAAPRRGLSKQRHGSTAARKGKRVIEAAALPSPGLQSL